MTTRNLKTGRELELIKLKTTRLRQALRFTDAPCHIVRICRKMNTVLISCRIVSTTGFYCWWL